MVGPMKQFDGHSPQASRVTTNTERKVSRWLDLGVLRPHCQWVDGNKHPSQHGIDLRQDNQPREQP